MRQVKIKQLKSSIFKEFKNLPFEVTVRGRVIATVLPTKETSKGVCDIEEPCYAGQKTPVTSDLSEPAYEEVSAPASPSPTSSPRKPSNPKLKEREYKPLFPKSTDAIVKKFKGIPKLCPSCGVSVIGGKCSACGTNFL